jgi:hypothetical protein
MAADGVHPGPAAHDLSGAPADQRRALRVLYWVLAIVVVDVVVGGGWDAEYHRTQPFDGFFSPPHIFIYSVASVAMGLVAWCVLSPSLRVAFGPAVRVGPSIGGRQLDVPQGLLLLAGGMAGLCLAAPLDAIWHTRFGLDETPWSLPHSMLGASMLTIALGMISARYALSAVPRRRWTVPLLCLLLLFGTMTVIGPLGNASPAAVEAAAQQGALAADADAQRLFRLYQEWNLNRTNPLFAVVGAAWAGFAMGVTRPLVQRTITWLALLLLVGWAVDAGTIGNAEALRLEKDPATTAGLPLIWAALPVALLRTRPRLGYLCGGLVFGVVAYAQWGWRESPVLALCLVPLAPLAALAAAWFGGWVARAVTEPAATARRLVLLLVIAWPVLTGTIDLLLRRTV